MEVIFEHVNYQTKAGKEVLKNIDYSFLPGKIVGIVGKSGSGKTTLLNLIALEILPKKGKICLGDYTITRVGMSKKVQDYQSNIGYVHSSLANEFAYETVMKELFYTLEKYNYNASKRERQVLKSLQIVGLNEEYLYRDPYTLSSGEKRLVALAKNISYNPKVLLLDNPSVGLSSDDKKKLISLLATMKTRYKKTIIIATQDMDFIHQIADELIVLENGKILVSGSKKDVYDKKEILEQANISLPKIVTFSNYVWKQKKIHLNYCNTINDLVKEILRKMESRD